MAPDYDLSNLPSPQVEVWISLQVDAIFSQIVADQAERMGFPVAPEDCIVSAMTEKPQSVFNHGERERTPRRLPLKTRRI